MLTTRGWNPTVHDRRFDGLVDARLDALGLVRDCEVSATLELIIRCPIQSDSRTHGLSHRICYCRLAFAASWCRWLFHRLGQLGLDLLLGSIVGQTQTLGETLAKL